MKKRMNVVRSLLASTLIVVWITSACDSQGIEEVFNIYGIPGQTDPPSFFRIDWSWEDKLTIQGFGVKSETVFPGFIGDVTTGNISSFYLNNSPLDGSIPLISKDGRYVAFHSQDKLYIVLMDKIASNNYVITPDSYVGVLVGENFPCDNLAWSPDSNRLAFVCVDLNNKLKIGLYDLTEKNVQDIFEYSEEYLMNGIEGVSWSSDGRMLAFSLRPEYHGDRSQTDIFIYHLDAGLLSRITNTSDVSERDPDWYPGSRILTFTSTVEGDAEIVDSDLIFSTEDGKCRKSLPKLRGFVYPSWSPDGSQLAYIADWMTIKVLDTSQFVPPDFLSPQGLCDSK
jgi:Tol biopolymer transport system component